MINFNQVIVRKILTEHKLGIDEPRRFKLNLTKLTTCMSFFLLESNSSSFLLSKKYLYGLTE